MSEFKSWNEVGSNLLFEDADNWPLAEPSAPICFVRRWYRVAFDSCFQAIGSAHEKQKLGSASTCRTQWKAGFWKDGFQGFQ